MEHLTLHLNWSKLLPLTEANLEQIGNIPAVFRVSKKSPDGNFYVVFVGSTATLQDELKAIQNGTIVNTILQAYVLQTADLSFRYAPLASEQTRKAVEKQMYRHYAPEANQEEPKSLIDVKANLN